MVALEDATGKTLFRQDLSEQEYLNGGLTFLAYEFESSFIPTKSIVWTYTTQKQWVHIIEKEIIS